MMVVFKVGGSQKDINDGNIEFNMWFLKQLVKGIKVIL